MVVSAANVTPESARISLMAFKRQSYAVDPDSKEHQDKHREMRLKFSRVSPAAFMKFLDAGKETVSSGASSSCSYWVAPKKNFPKGLPPKLKAAEVAEDAANDALQDVDRLHFYMIDQCVSREQLGKGVWTVTAFNSTVNKFQSSGSSSGSRQRLERADGAATGAGDLPQQSAPAAATGAGDAIPRRGSRRLRENTSSGGDDDTEGPAAKKSRMVTDTLATLKANIDSAKDAGIWISANVLSNNSVLFWVQQTVGAMEEMVRDAGLGDKNSSQRIVCRFTNYLLQLAQESECYPHWTSFSRLLPKLIEAGGPAIPQRTADEAELLERLARTNPDTDNQPVMVEGVSVLSRANFFNSKIYHSFICHRVGHSFKSARLAPTAQRRLEILSAWSEAKGLPSHLANGIKQAMQMFDPKINLSERIAFVLGEKLEKMALDWDATGPVGAAALMCCEAPNLGEANITYEVFLEAANAIYDADLVGAMQNPLMNSAVSIVGDIGERNELLVMHCVCSRLGLPVAAESQVPNQALFERIPKTDLKTVATKVKDFFHKAADPPPWVAQLTAVWQAEAQVRLEARQARVVAAASEGTTARVVAAASEGTTAPMADAGLPVAAGDALAPPAATGADPVIWTIGQTVTVKFGSGRNPMNGKKAKITNVLTSHCWVEILEGPNHGVLKKIVKTNLTPLMPVAPAVAEDAEVVAVAEEADDVVVAPAADSATDSLGDWEAAEGVF